MCVWVVFFVAHFLFHSFMLYIYIWLLYTAYPKKKKKWRNIYRNRQFIVVNSLNWIFQAHTYIYLHIFSIGKRRWKKASDTLFCLSFWFFPQSIWYRILHCADALTKSERSLSENTYAEENNTFFSRWQKNYCRLFVPIEIQSTITMEISNKFSTIFLLLYSFGCILVRG